MAKDNGIRQHKEMAGAGGGGSFGVDQTLGGVPFIKHQDNPVHGKGISHAPMADSERHPPLPRAEKMLQNQRHPHHGPHHIGNKHPDNDKR